MLFRLEYDEALAQAAYLIGCQRTGEAIVFDPERDVDRYLELAREHGLRIVAVAETHIHADFLSGARELASQAGAKVHVSGLGGPDWRSKWLEGIEHLELEAGAAQGLVAQEQREHAGVELALRAAARVEPVQRRELRVHRLRHDHLTGAGRG